MYKLQVIWKEQRKVQDNRDVFVICTSYLGGILYIVLIKREILTSTINQKKSFKPHVRYFFFKKKFLPGLIIKRGVFKILKYLTG